MDNLIKGIDEVIKGLTTIKGALLVRDSAPVIKEVVKEAIEEVIPVIETAPVNEVIEEESKDEAKLVEEVEEPTEKELEQPKLEAQEEVEEVEEVVDFTREELEAMKYTELKTLASELGLKGSGKKAELVDRILAEGVKPEEEEEVIEEDEVVEDEVVENEVVENEVVENEVVENEVVEDEEQVEDEEVEEFVDFLASLEVDDLKEIAKEAKVKVGKIVNKDKLIQDLVADLDVLVEALDALGYYDDGEEEESEEAVTEEVVEDEVINEEDDTDEVKIAEEYGLEEYSLEELADICNDYGLSTKGKKQALIDRIVKGILDGTIEFEDDDEEEVEEVAHEEEERKVQPLKKEEGEVNNIMLEKEEEVEKEIIAKYEKGKLKDSTIKKFLDKYNEGDPECAGCKGCSTDEKLECYIDIYRALVDDDGEVNGFEEPYIRHGEYHCCGKEINELDNGDLFCSVCGTQYES